MKYLSDISASDNPSFKDNTISISLGVKLYFSENIAKRLSSFIDEELFLLFCIVTYSINNGINRIDANKSSTIFGISNQSVNNDITASTTLDSIKPIGANFNKDLSNKTIKNYVKYKKVMVNGKVITKSSFLLICPETRN